MEVRLTDWHRRIALSWLISSAERLDMDRWFVYISSGNEVMTLLL